MAQRQGVRTEARGRNNCPDPKFDPAETGGAYEPGGPLGKPGPMPTPTPGGLNPSRPIPPCWVRVALKAGAVWI